MRKFIGVNNMKDAIELMVKDTQKVYQDLLISRYISLCTSQGVRLSKDEAISALKRLGHL
jgi:hypothetical protein